MNYKEYLDEYFAKYKDTKKAKELYQKILIKASYKYESLLRDNYGSGEANTMVIQELKLLKQNYPILITLPRKSKEEANLNRRSILFIIIGYIIGMGCAYIYIPAAAIFLQLICAFAIFAIFKVGEENPNSKNTILPWTFLGMFLFQIIMMMILFPLESVGIVVMSFGYAVFFLLIIFGFFGFARNREKIRNRKTIIRVINGQLFKSADAYILVLYIFVASVMFALHFFFVLVEEIFNFT